MNALDSILAYKNSAVFKFLTLHRLLDRIRLNLARRNVIENQIVQVSYIVATYNRGKILTQRTLPSLLSQTIEDIEVIVVGDNASEETAEQINKLKDERLTFLNLRKRGKYPSDPLLRWYVQGSVPRNRGARIAAGKWLAFPSDDDVIYSNHAETMLKFAENRQLESASAHCIEYRNGQDRITPVVHSENKLTATPTWIYRSYLKFFKWSRHSWRKHWNRPVDYDLSERMFRAGVKHGVCPEVLAYKPEVDGTGTVGFSAQIELAKKGC